jgi:hypothetical protein
MNWVQTERSRNPSPVPPQLPERFRDAVLAEIPAQLGLRELALQYLDGFWSLAPQGIAPVLLGPAGTYKTYTACAIVRRVGAHLESQFVSCPVEFATRALERYSGPTRQWIESLYSTPFLVLDDFLLMKVGSWESDVLRAILMARFDGLRPTLLTANAQDMARVEETCGVTVARRVHDVAGDFLVRVSCSEGLPAEDETYRCPRQRDAIRG